MLATRGQHGQDARRGRHGAAAADTRVAAAGVLNEGRAFRHRPSEYTSYGIVEYCAGKSLGTLRPDLTSCGAHHFSSSHVIGQQVAALEGDVDRAGTRCPVNRS